MKPRRGTHLILPMTILPSAAVAKLTPVSNEARYVAALVRVFSAKADRGEFDERLAQKIEHILGSHEQ